MKIASMTPRKLGAVCAEIRSPDVKCDQRLPLLIHQIIAASRLLISKSYSNQINPIMLFQNSTSKPTNSMLMWSRRAPELWAIPWKTVRLYTYRSMLWNTLNLSATPVAIILTINHGSNVLIHKPKILEQIHPGKSSLQFYPGSVDVICRWSGFNLKHVLSQGSSA